MAPAVVSEWSEEKYLSHLGKWVESFACYSVFSAITFGVVTVPTCPARKCLDVASGLDRKGLAPAELLLCQGHLL